MADAGVVPIGGSWMMLGSKRIAIPPELFRAIEEIKNAKDTALMNVSFVGGSVAAVDVKVSKKYK